MKHIVLATILCASSLAALPARGENRFRVHDGRAQAEIVIAESPPRTARLAAAELQTCIAKISGAKLPIVMTPNPQVPVQVYIGQSPQTEKLRITADAEQIVVDGKLDDEYWQKCPTAATGRFRELRTGRQPVFGTTFNPVAAAYLDPMPVRLRLQSLRIFRLDVLPSTPLANQ